MIEAQPVKRLTLHPLRHRLIGVSQSQCQVLEFWPLTERKIGVSEIGTPSTDSVISAPTARRCIDSVLDLQCITKLEELSPRTRRRLQGLPVPQIITYWVCVSKMLSNRQKIRNSRTWDAHAPVTSSRCVTAPMPNSFLRALICDCVPSVKTWSKCAITASTSAEQFCGMNWRIGSKYPQ